MSLEVTAVSNHAPEFDPSKPAPPPVPTPTASQELESLAIKGFSAEQIALTLNIPLAQVETALGIDNPSATSTKSATAVEAAASRLSVQA
jgi:hypothetical protein